MRNGSCIMLNCHRQRISRRNRPTLQPRCGLYPEKIMLSGCWDIQGIFHYELFNNNKKKNTSNLYCNQLCHFKTALSTPPPKKNRPSLVNTKGVILHHDNARPRTAQLTKDLLKEARLEKFLYPPYYPDLASSDYQWFWGITESFGWS